MTTNYCPSCGKPTVPNAKFCTSCGATLRDKDRGESQLRAKREKVVGGHRAQRKYSWKIILGVAAVGLVGGWIYMNLPEGGNPVIKKSPAVTAPVRYPQAVQQMIDVPAKVENGKITVPVSLLSEKRFLAFSYNSPRGNFPLLAYITGEGRIVTAVSMCEPCNSTRFHIRGDKLVCNACGSTWELNNLQPVSGACGRFPPDAVPNVIVGTDVQIDEQIVARWQRRV